MKRTDQVWKYQNGNKQMALFYLESTGNYQLIISKTDPTFEDNEQGVLFKSMGIEITQTDMRKLLNQLHREMDPRED